MAEISISDIGISDMFVVEGLLDNEDMDVVVKDPEGLMMYESHTESCCIVDNDHIDTSSSWFPSSGCPVLSDGADPWAAGEPEEPTTIMMTSTSSHHATNNHSTGSKCQLPQIINFGFGRSDDCYYEDGHNWSELKAAANKRKASYAKEHVLVEKRRRNKLAQRFIQLHASIPSLSRKRVDKATILEEAVKYIKQIEEQSKLVEQQTKEKKEESTNLTQKIQASKIVDDGRSSENDNFSSLEIDVQVYKDILIIKIRTQLNYIFFQRILRGLEKLHLKVIDCNVTPGKYAMDTTVVTQIETTNKCCMTAEHVVKHMEVCLQENCPGPLEK